MSYLIKNGKIHNTTCEVNVTLHCNLSCQACSHMSPVSEKHNMKPAELERDLSILSKYYHADHVRLMGGEPLLHPDILDLIDITLKSGITEKIRIITNGTLLWKMPEIFWKKVQEVNVSVYPGKAMTEEQYKKCYYNSLKYKVDFKMEYVPAFRESFSASGTDDESLIQSIYDTCLTVHLFRSHTLHEGYLYKCPQSLFISMFLKNEIFPDLAADGIKIEDRPDFGKKLLAFLERKEVLKSCKYCLACVGEILPVKQVDRKDWWKPREKKLEEMISIEDLSMLKWLEKLWVHYHFIRNNVKTLSTSFGQVFYLDHQKGVITMIWVRIEQIFFIHFSMFLEWYPWYNMQRTHIL